MFEQPQKTDRKLLWKVIPVAAGVFLAVVLLIVFFSIGGSRDTAPLTGVLHAGHPTYDWYQKYVVMDVKNQKIQLGKNYLGDRIVMCSGLIENGGEKALDVVEVKLVLFNYDKPVWETTRTPIRPDGRIEPIPPLGKRSFSLYLEALPESWYAGQAEMTISGFRFVDVEQRGAR
jgi:hypothetical protein